MDLEVVGRHALFFDDDAAAAFVNAREALVPWNDNPALLIDRYDVRHLLDRIPARSSVLRPRGLEDAGDVSLSDLDRERYLDLPPPSDGDGAGSDSETMKRSEATGSGAYQAVPMFYGDTTSTGASKYSDSGISVFHPPFTVPESLHSNLPPTEKLHQIIARTAIFVSEHGGQSEIVLRVKQGDNPTFGFLVPDHHLHAYFRYLVDHPELLKENTDSSETQEKKPHNLENEAHVAAGGALSLLGSVYESGDDDDDAHVQPGSKEMKPDKFNSAGSGMIPHRSEQEEPSVSKVSVDKETIKRSVAAAVKEKTFSSKINHEVNTATCSAPNSRKAGDACASTRGALSKSQNSQSDIKPVILEPPSFLKGAIDKIVEFIIRNGKEFEAILIEQDKTAGRFPFLLPSNHYHSYYLKILDEAREPKLLGKNLSDAGSKKKRQESPTKGYGVYASNLAEQSEGMPCDPQRKEKFKMTIGGAKKDTHDQRPKPGRQSGLSADEVAAILQAAIRGSSPANTDQHPTAARQSGATADEAAAIVLAATRGLSPANADQLPAPAKQPGIIADEAAAAKRGFGPAKTNPLPPTARQSAANADEAVVIGETRGSSPIDSFRSMSMDESGTCRTRGDSGWASSNGSLYYFQGQNSFQKPLSKCETDTSLPLVSSRSTGKLDKVSSDAAGDVLVAKVIAKTVALAASNEADSSEAGLTKEQKLKAERLKRAKMFAAAIKSGTSAVNDLANSVNKPIESLEASNADSIRSGAEAGVVEKEREGSSVPFDAEISERIKSRDQYRKNSSRKTHLSRARDLDDSDEDHNSSRKKYRSKDSSNHSRDQYRHEKNHSKYHSTSRDKELKHHKHHTPSEDDHKHRKRTSSRHRHRDDLSENEDEERSDRHRRRHRSHSEKQRDIEEEKSVKTTDHVDISLISSNHHEEMVMPGASDAQRTDGTEVPSDLRAKVRAMLLETM